MDDVDWDGLVQRARAGDAHALDDLLARVRPLVVRRCATFLPYNDDAQEAAQEVLITIASRLDSYAGRGSFLGWVTVVASNQARMTYRSMRRRFDEASLDAPLDRSGHEQAPDPRTTSVIAGTRLDLLDALEALEVQHPSAVEAFVLRDLGALPYDEVAALTGVPLGTVKARIHTARQLVREKLSGGDNFSSRSRISTPAAPDEPAR